MNDDARKNYNVYLHLCPIKLKTTTLKSSLFKHSDACIPVKGTTSVTAAESDATARQACERKQVIFKNCAPLTDCISEIINKQVDNAKKP